jgi:ABC-type nitrate/sulfonate/bicarbonate transport system permease component
MNDARSRSAHAGSLGRTNPLGGLVLGGALLAVGFAAWQFAATAQIQPEHILPAPGRILEALSDHWPNLSAASVVTVRTVAFATLIGLAIAAPVCVVLGALAIAMPGFGRALRFLAIWIGDASPLLIVTLLPIFIMWAGVGEGTRIRASATGAALAFVAAMLGVLTTHGLAGIAPAVLRGLRHATLLALLLAVVCDMVAGRDGLGHMVLAATAMLNMALAMAATLVIWIVGLLAAALLLVAEWAVTRAVERVA